MSWRLEIAEEADIDELMTWFSNAHSVNIWGGPVFRYPFDRETFFEDCHWQEFSSYCLRSPDNDFAAFGQLGCRYGRSHLARLVANPKTRGQGIGRKLIEMMIATSGAEHNYSEVGLFVFEDNEPACRCYSALGFEVQEYPEDAPMLEKCVYLTRSIN